MYEYDIYRDGGTLVLFSPSGTYYIDGRMQSETKDMVFSQYPSETDYISDPKKIKDIIREFKSIVDQNYLELCNMRLERCINKLETFLENN